MASITKEQLDQHPFVVVKDTNTGRVRRIIIPGDVQVGYIDHPKDLQLFGKLQLSSKDYHLNNSVTRVMVSEDETIINVAIDASTTVDSVTVVLPQPTTVGQLIIIKDINDKAGDVSIVLTCDSLIENRSSITLSTAGDFVALYWTTSGWKIFSISVTGYYNISAAPYADISSSFLMVNAPPSASLNKHPNRRLATVGTGIRMTDGGAASTGTGLLTFAIDNSTVATITSSWIDNTRRRMPISASHVIVWSFDEVTGSTVAASTGTSGSASLTAIGRVDFGRAGMFGNCVSLTGSTGTAQVTALQGAPTAAPNVKNFSIMGWILPMVFGDNFSPIFTKWIGGTWVSPFEGMSLRFFNTNDGTWYAQYTIGGVTYTTLGAGRVGEKNLNDRFKLGVWNHFGVVFQRDAGLCRVILYLNGNQVLNFNQGAVADGNIQWGTAGNWQINNSSGSTNYSSWTGEFDEFRVINECLSSSYFEETWKRGMSRWAP